MTITQGHVSVGTAATPIIGTGGNPGHVMIHNNDNADNIYLGGSSVTVATGLTLGKSERIDFDLLPAEQLYGLTVQVLKIRINSNNGVPIWANFCWNGLVYR